MDDRFYILVNGKCLVERHGKTLGSIDSGDCFGETSYVRGARRTATIKAETRRVRAARELDAARAGVRRLPAALQPRVPARADRRACRATTSRSNRAALRN